MQMSLQLMNDQSNDEENRFVELNYNREAIKTSSSFVERFSSPGPCSFIHGHQHMGVVLVWATRPLAPHCPQRFELDSIIGTVPQSFRIDSDLMPG